MIKSDPAWTTLQLNLCLLAANPPDQLESLNADGIDAGTELGWAAEDAASAAAALRSSDTPPEALEGVVRLEAVVTDALDGDAYLESTESVETSSLWESVRLEARMLMETLDIEPIILPRTMNM